MASRRAQHAAIAAASDGSVLINVLELLSNDVQARLSKELGTASLFVGVPLNQSQASQVVNRLDGAAAEASAQLLAGRVTKQAKTRSKTARRTATKRR